MTLNFLDRLGLGLGLSFWLCGVCGVALGVDLSTALERTGGVSARDSKECWPSAALGMTESIGLYSGRQVRGLTWDERRYPWIDSLRHHQLDLHCHPRLDRGSCAG